MIEIDPTDSTVTVIPHIKSVFVVKVYRGKIILYSDIIKIGLNDITVVRTSRESNTVLVLLSTGDLALVTREIITLKDEWMWKNEFYSI